VVIRIAKIRIGANPNIAIFPVKNGFGIETEGVFFSMDDGMIRYALPVLILCGQVSTFRAKAVNGVSWVQMIASEQ